MNRENRKSSYEREPFIFLYFIKCVSNKRTENLLRCHIYECQVQ